jgi:hypothetical protein
MTIEAELPDWQPDFAWKRELVTRSSRHFGRSLPLLARNGHADCITRCPL